MYLAALDKYAARASACAQHRLGGSDRPRAHYNKRRHTHGTDSRHASQHPSGTTDRRHGAPTTGPPRDLGRLASRTRSELLPRGPTAGQPSRAARQPAARSRQTGPGLTEGCPPGGMMILYCRLVSDLFVHFRRGLVSGISLDVSVAFLSKSSRTPAVCRGVEIRALPRSGPPARRTRQLEKPSS